MHIGGKAGKFFSVPASTGILRCPSPANREAFVFRPLDSFFVPSKISGLRRSMVDMSILHYIINLVHDGVELHRYFVVVETISSIRCYKAQPSYFVAQSSANAFAQNTILSSTPLDHKNADFNTITRLIVWPVGSPFDSVEHFPCQTPFCDIPSLR